MIENWEFYAAIGLGITTIAGISFFISTEDKIKKEIERYESIFKSNFYEEWLDKIKKRLSENLEGYTDSQLNSGLRELFCGAGFFENCRSFNLKRRMCPSLFKGLIAAIGIYIASFPYFEPLEQEIKTIYFSGGICIIILFIIVVIYCIYVNIMLKLLLGDLNNKYVLRVPENQAEDQNNAGE